MIEVFGMQLEPEKLIAGVMPFIANLVAAVVIYIVGKWVAKKLVHIVEKIGLGSKIDMTLMKFVGNLLYGLLLALVILTSLNKLGVDTTSAMAILGGGAIAIGMALQTELANIAAGVMIILFRPYNLEDYVEIDGKEGNVKAISMMSTQLQTLDNHLIIIPNKNITSNSITNFTMQATRRINEIIGIGYGDDIKQAREVMLKVITAHPKVLNEPAPAVKVANLGDSSVDMNILAWVKSDDWLLTKLDLIEEIKIALDDAGIEIPFPQRSLHIVGASTEQQQKLAS